MRPSALFNALAGLALWPLVACAQPWLTREGDLWVRTFQQTAAAKPRLRILAQGPVTLQGNVSENFAFTVKVSVRARTREQAVSLLEKVSPRVEAKDEWLVVSIPAGNLMASVTMRAPHLREAAVSSSDGDVAVSGIDGPLTVETGAGTVKADRIGGACTLSTGGGEIRVGQVEGSLAASTGEGSITVRSAGGQVILQTNGGDIEALRVGGAARVQTGGGAVHLGVVEGAVTAVDGGGSIVVDQAGGMVTTRNMAGPVRVGAAAGIRCDSANGSVQLGNITGPLRVSTLLGNIVANLPGGKLVESYLATGNGDITVSIPSNLGVTVSAENQMADSIRRILSDFQEIQPRLRGMCVIAEGSVHGGGPLLRISASSGTIFLKRQRQRTTEVLR
jgi:DUF4097 and DUF4098 domain-containing protein YvlB